MPEDAYRAELVISFYRVRQALGVMGLLLPVLLIIGGWMSLGGVEPSISDYYHTVLRDVFVGVMTAIAMFLIAYPGHQRQAGEYVSDDRLTTIAGIAALGVAFFPNENRFRLEVLQSPAQQILGHKYAAIGHYTCAILFLTLLAVLCLRKFSRSAKPARRRIYRTCGWTILLMTIGVIVASYFKINGPVGPQAFVNDYMIVLWLEAVAVWAFAIAWLTKGRADLALARVARKPLPRVRRLTRTEPPASAGGPSGSDPA